MGKRRKEQGDGGGVVVEESVRSINQTDLEEEEDVVGWWGTADEAKDALDGAVGKARACWRRSTGERASSSPSELTAVNGIPAGT